MLGIVVINASNDVVQSFGNKAFCSHIGSLANDCIAPKATTSRVLSSSSSGISSTESAFVKQSHIVHKPSSSNKIDDNVLLPYVLPLLAIYQTKKSKKDELSFLYSENVKFCFVTYDSSHIIIGICDESYSEMDIQQLCLRVQNLLSFYYGPFIYFIKADLSSVKKKRLRIEKRVADLIEQVESGTLRYPLLNVNFLTANIESYSSFMPQFRKIATTISDNIGNCRCIFVSRGQVIGSVSTKQKQAVPLFELINPEDVNNLVHMCKLLDQWPPEGNEPNLRKKLQHHVEQVWVHFRTGLGPSLPPNRRQLVNAFLFSLSGEIDLICLNAVDQSAPIHTASDLLDLLEDIEGIEDKTAFVAKAGEKVQKLTNSISNFNSKISIEDLKFVFLDNATRASTLIKNLWSRLHVEILSSTKKEIIVRPGRTLSSLLSPSALSHLHKWNSTASLLSVASSWKSMSSSNASSGDSTPSENSSVMSFPIQTIAMVRHFQRQLRFVLNELCIYSTFVAKSEKYKSAECGIRRVMDRTTNFTVPMPISNSIKERNDNRSLSPAKLGFDMFGYVFYRTDVSMNVTSYQDSYSKLFFHAQSSKLETDLTVIRLTTGELFIQITSTPAHLPSEEILCLDLPISCAAVFPEAINTQLAINQTMNLAALLHHKSVKFLSIKMLATTEIRSLLLNTKIERVLGGNLLPANNNPSFLDLGDVSTVTVVEDDPKGAIPVAFGLFHQTSVNQAYCSVVTLKKGYERNFVVIERVKNDMGIDDPSRHTCYKIAEVREGERNTSSLPQYFNAFAVQDVYPLHQCVVDKLIDQTIGHANMDMKKNLTVDLYDTHSGRFAELKDNLWRDRDGFVVGDKFRFNEIEISRAALLNLLQKTEKDPSLTFEPLTPKTSAAFLEYDSEVGSGDRSEYLEYLFRLTGVKGTVVFDSTKRPAGYIISLGNHILQCYGDSPAIASNVLSRHVSQMIEPNLTMFIRMDNQWISKELSDAANVVRRIRRFHSRIVPTTVKWPKVFSLNVGTHLY
ncbi:hypothetical protein FO519_005057 [Halicephalobus sp. NKZ332]|nr:hypothetical protein FO519_005057 [Halicephalobus sp. NKZ332]